jgi:hypothetical protein
VPASSRENRQPVVEMLTRRLGDIDVIVDVGPGEGTYADLLRPLFPRAHMTAVEVWAPYVRRFRLHQKYDRVIVADSAWLDWSRVAEGALVVFGDVLEHMAEESARWCWDQARRHAKWVLLSIPIHPHPQAEVDGNPYEAHVSQWTHPKVIDTFVGIDEWWIGQVVGVYLAPTRNGCAISG